MKVELIRVDGKPVGYTIKGETSEEKAIVNVIRDLNLWGIDETGMVYNGRTVNLFYLIGIQKRQTNDDLM